jgi:hypothetical protein
MVDLSSSDTKEALELLSLSPAHGYHSSLSNYLSIGPRITIWLQVSTLR